MSDSPSTAPKTIFISGGASGIGRATAQFFAERGWVIGLGDIDEAGMKETLALLPKGGASAYPLDVTKPKEWRDALAAFAKEHGGINVLSNNAGIPAGGMLAELSEEEIDRVLDINLRGVINGARAAYPYLKASAPSAAMVNTCSAAGIYGTPGMSTYCVSKFGVRALTESLDAEWRPDGIKVHSIMPSFIDTPLLTHTVDEGDNVPIRERIMAAGLEFTPVEKVARAVWDAAHGRKLHYLVGKTARRLAFAAKWMPEKLRQSSRPLPGMRQRNPDKAATEKT